MCNCDKGGGGRPSGMATEYRNRGKLIMHGQIQVQEVPRFILSKQLQHASCPVVCQ
jgi:hypothetical protein